MSVAAAAWVLMMGLAAGGCFEDGGLDAVALAQETSASDSLAVDTAVPDGSGGDSAGPDSAEMDSGGGETDAVHDTVDEGDTMVAQDTSDTRDTSDTAVAADTTVVVGPPCLTVADCAAVDPGDDLCVAQLACVDYVCTTQPVTCPDTGDPCTEAHCVPSDGSCVVEDVCICEPQGDLACDGALTYLTEDAAVSDAVQDYSCGGAGSSGAGTERVVAFVASRTERVRMRASGSAVAGVWVMNLTSLDPARCDAQSCVAGGSDQAFFEAQAGVSYAVAVEHGGAGEVALSAACDVTTETICDDERDDDGDGAVDCADGECAADPACQLPPESACDNLLDDDDDSFTDCDDSDCSAAPNCQVATETHCSNQVDDDGDGPVDCLDSDCDADPACQITAETNCSNQIDDDGDGPVDCLDSDCAADPACQIATTEGGATCFDEIDNEPDGATDCADQDCWGEAACLQPCHVTTNSIGCGFNQGIGTGGGKSQMENYSCHGDELAGKEIVYRFSPQGAGGAVTVTMSSGTGGMRLHLLRDEGQGCTPLHCLQTGPSISFVAVGGTTYFFAIDAPAGVSGSYQIGVACDF